MPLEGRNKGSVGLITLKFATQELTLILAMTIMLKSPLKYRLNRCMHDRLNDGRK